MEMQNQLLKHRGMQPDDRMPSQEFLYHYSRLLKDLQDAQAQASIGK
jgi:hypothetical protein